MATETAPPRASPTPQALATRVGVVVAALAFLVLTSVLAASDRIVLPAAVLLSSVALAVAAVTAWRSFALFVCGVIVVRPLLDLTAGPRAAGLSPTDVFGGAVLLVSLAWLLLNRAEALHRLRLRLAFAVVAMAGVMLLSALAAPHLTSALQLVLRVITGAVLFLVVDLLLHRGLLTARVLVTALAAAYVVPLLYPLLALVGVTVRHEKDGVEALKSVFFLSNNYGHFLVPLVAVAAAWVAHVRGRSRIAALVVVGVAGIELLATQTRGAWVATVVAVLCVGVLLNRRLVLATAAVTVLVALYVPAVNARLTSLEQDADQPRTESSLVWRFGHWEELLPRATESPLLGLGPDESVLLTGKEPHNDYVRALVETALLGIATYLWFLAALGAVAVRAVRVVGGTPLRASPRIRVPPRVYDRATQATVVGLGGSMAGAMVASLGENLIDNVTFLSILMPCAALLVHAAEGRWSWAWTSPDRPEVAPAPAPPRASGP